MAISAEEPSDQRKAALTAGICIIVMAFQKSLALLGAWLRLTYATSSNELSCFSIHDASKK